MSRLFWLTEDQVERISPFFPKERGVGRANDRKVLSGIIYVIKNGLQWADAPIEYGPHKTLYNRFRRWSENGVFERIFEELAKPQDDAGSVLKPRSCCHQPIQRQITLSAFSRRSGKCPLQATRHLAAALRGCTAGIRLQLRGWCVKNARSEWSISI